MDTAETSVHPLAPVEEAQNSCKEPDEVWDRGGEGLEVSHERARPLVELRGLSYESVPP